MAILSRDPRTEQAGELMLRFAERTGLNSRRPARRYLWTDAFALGNFLSLARRTGRAYYSDLATELVDQVHHVLGRHRADDPRRGWISGLDDAAGELHPTIGGLRIGKPLPERTDGDRAEPHLEWDRDGQYFHYLTRWMLALERFARVAGRAPLLAWARELADTAHRWFTVGEPGSQRMIWKLSIDLTRPLVDAMGQRDPLDGLVTCLELEAAATELDSPQEPPLTKAIADYAAMVGQVGLTTTDPLGLGGLLVDAQRLAALPAGPGELLDGVLAAAASGLDRFARQYGPTQPTAPRLAFRELGLVIGLDAYARIERGALSARAHGACTRIDRHTQLRGAIESFWLRAEHQTTSTWTEHADLNDVTLATCLCPDGLLASPPHRR